MPAPNANPIDTVIDALNIKGKTPKGNPQRGYIAQCPAHEDRSPSLSIREGDNGNALIYCHAGCTTDTIIRALDLTFTDLFPARDPRTPNPLDDGRRYKASYHYHNSDGELLYRVVKYVYDDGRKTFRQQRPIPGGKWLSTISGVQRVLYNLPQVDRAIKEQRTIWLVEGEKDAENVSWCFGVTATCNPGGADNGTGTKFTPEMADTLNGAPKIVICIDNDDAGHRHARHVASLLAGRVDRIIVVAPTIGKDISDHLSQHGTIEQLDQLDDTANPTGWITTVSPTELLDPSPEPDDTVIADYITDSLIDWATVRESLTEQQWELAPLIAQGRTHLIYAAMKSGKSLLLQWLLAKAALGHPTLDTIDGRPRRILYLDAENSIDDLIERLDTFGINTDQLADAGTFHYSLLPNIAKGIDHHEDAQVIVQRAIELEVDIVIIDTAPAFVAGEENSADTWSEVARLVTRPLKAAGIASVRVDHLGKDTAKGPRGSSAKVADADLVWKLAPADDGGFKLTRKYTRMPWVPETVDLARTETNGIISWTHVGAQWPAGTKDCANDLDALDLPVDLRVDHALHELRNHDLGKRREIVVAAVRYRREREMLAWGKPCGEPREPSAEPDFETGGN